MSLKTLFKWHLWLGLVSGLCMFVVGMTGALAVFAPEIDWLVIKPLRVSPPPEAQRQRVDAETIVAKVQAAYPDARVGSLNLSVRPSFAHLAAVIVSKDGRNQRTDVYVNPYTGEIQGERLVTAGYFSSVYQFLRQTHVRLLMGLWGRVFVGVLGVSLVLSCITGLWIYRGWIKKMFTLRLGGGWGNRMPWAEMHKFIGVWSLLFNIVIGITGAVLGIENLTGQINSKWIRPARAAAAPATATAEPAAPKTLAQTRQAAQRATGPSLPLNTLLARAKEAFPDLTPRTVLLPARPGAPLAIRGDVPSMLVMQSHVRTANGITLNSSTGEVIAKNDGRNATGWTRIYNTFDPLHFGYFGGLPTKILWFILGLTPGVLAVTGTWMWWRRRSRATTPAKTAAPAIPPATSAINTRLGLAVGVVTLIAAYAIVAVEFKNWNFTHRLAEFWLVKPISIALCAFPITILLVWLATRARTRPWLFGGSCALMGGWYLLLTSILMP
jgi:uncharacterized iron-regulated membrane protein